MERRSSDYFSGKMFWRQFVPALVSSIGLALGDMMDAVVVGQSMGVIGLAAISLSLPVFMVVNVLMHGLGIGGSIRFSTQLAQGEKEKAREGFQGILAVALAVAVLLSVAGNLFLTPLLAVLGTTPEDGLLFETSRTYVRIIVSGIPLIVLSYVLNYYLRNDDCEKLASLGFTMGNVTDIALNIILVLGCGMGAAGAAFATLAGQVVSIGFYLPAFRKKGGTLRIFPFSPAFEGSFSCFRTGFSSSVQFLFSMLFILIANNILMYLSGSVGVAAFDMVQNASYLILYLYDGTAKAMQPLVSTYYGEHDRHSIRHTLKLGLLSGTAVGAVAICLTLLFPDAICTLFGMTEPESMRLGMYAIRVFCAGAAFAGISVILESYFQSCEEERAAWILTTLRGAAILLPATFLCSFFGEKGFWWLYPVTEILTLLLFGLWRTAARKTSKAFDEDRVLTAVIRSTNEELSPLMAQIEEFCERWGASTRQTYFVTMSAEELCLVIMAKGFQENSGYIQITLIAEENRQFSLHVRDSAISFNPFSLRTARADSGGDFDMDAIGVLVIREKATEFFYRHYQGFNTVIVKI
ncbi:MAG: MATE family efflux transporter [Clostridiales bacterium]|nr:MATE family efflux transporter [Clostridiales bacterium]